MLRASGFCKSRSEKREISGREVQRSCRFKINRAEEHLRAFWLGFVSEKTVDKVLFYFT